MAARHPVAIDPGGGARIPSLRPARARLITGVGAVAALAAAGAYSTSTAGSLAGLALGIAIAACVVLSLGLVLRWPSTIAWAVLLEAGAYLSARGGKASVDGWAAVIGVLLLLAAELASWSIDHDARIKTEGRLLTRRLLTLGALVVVALFVNLMLLAASVVATPAGVLLAAVGVAASVAAVAVVLRLLRT